MAAALSHNAKHLILDEPTSCLDPLVRDELIDMLADYTRDASHSILIPSHIVSDLEKICDYIAFLHKGKLMLCVEKDVLPECFGLLHTTREVGYHLARRITLDVYTHLGLEDAAAELDRMEEIQNARQEMNRTNSEAI